MVIKPIKCETNGNKSDSISNKIASTGLILNLINNIMSPIINIGVVRTKLLYILDINIFFVLIGNDFKILIFLPSRLITELVIDVVKAVNEIKTNINNDKLFITTFLSKPNPFLSISIGNISLNFRHNPIDININNTKLNPAFTMNTGVLKNVFNSFFTSETILD